MILEFKRKADAAQLEKILSALDPSMNERQVAAAFGLGESDIKKLFFRQPCFAHLTPAERLTPSGRAIHKSGRSFCLELEYEFPGDGGQAEHELTRWFERVARRLQLKMVKAPPLRKRSQYLDAIVEEILGGASARVRAYLIEAVGDGRPGSFPRERIPVLLRRFDEEIELQTITASNKPWLAAACRSLHAYYSTGKYTDPAMSDRYAAIATRIGATDVTQTQLSPPSSTREYEITFTRADGRPLDTADFTPVIMALLDNFGYLMTDFSAYQLGDSANGHDDIRSAAHLHKILSDYPESEPIYLSWKNNPVFIGPLFALTQGKCVASKGKDRAFYQCLADNYGDIFLCGRRHLD